MSKKEKIVVAVLFLLGLAVFQYATSMNYYASQLDSAMMVGNIETTRTEGRPISQINASALKAIATVVPNTAHPKAEDVCAQPLVEEKVEVVEMFSRHAYVILYALAPLSVIASAQTVAAIFHVAAFVGLLLAVYLCLRNEKLSIPAALLFVALVVVHPGWSASAFGQFYPDRFFILVGFIYVWLLHRRLTNHGDHTFALIITAAIAASLTERAAIMVGISTLVLMMLRRDWRGWTRKDYPIVGVAVASLMYAMLYMKLFQVNQDYGSFFDQALSFFSNISNNEAFRLGIQKFLWVNLPWLLLSLFEWRLAVLAFVMMLPNLVGSIGGAEKIGWSTHYHSMYFPFLMAAASIGFLHLCKLLDNYWKKWALFSAIGVVASYIAVLNPFVASPFWEFDSKNLGKNAFSKAVAILANSGDGESIKIYADFNRAAADAVPANVSVSSYEGMMPALLGKGRVLHYYPLGIGSDDYLLVSYAKDDKGELKFSGATSYMGLQNLAALDACLNVRIAKDYQLEKTVSPGADTGYGAAILKRVKKE